MIARSFQTRFWSDDFIAELSPEEKLLFIYYFTNSRLGKTGAYECTDRVTNFETGISVDSIKKIKEKISSKILFIDNWVVILNAHKYNNYKTNELLKKSFVTEYSQLPSFIQEHINIDDIDIEKYITESKEDTSIKLVSDKSNTDKIPQITYHNINKVKEKDVKEKQNFSSLSSITPEVINEIAEYYHCSTSFVNIQFEKMKNWLEGSGKVKKNYKATLRNFVLSELEKTNKGARIEIGVKPEAKTVITPTKPETPEDKIKSRMVANKVRQDLEKRGILRTVKSF